jgi:hypothetical protein
MTAAAAFAGSVGQNTQLGDAIHWRGGYVLVGEVSPTTGPSSSTTGLIWASPDGTTWERVANGAGLFDAAEIDAVAARGSELVAVGNATRADAGPPAPTPPVGLVWNSSDGVHWTRNQGADATIGQARIIGVVAGPDGFVAWGQDLKTKPALFFSADGVAWQRVAQNDAAFSGQDVNQLIATSTGFAAIGGQHCQCVENTTGAAAAWWSADGLTWHASDVGTGGYFIDLFELWPGSLRALGSCGACTTKETEWGSDDDGRSWQQLPAARDVPLGLTYSTLLDDGVLIELETTPTLAARWTADGHVWHSLALAGVPLPDQTRLQVANDRTLIAAAPSEAGPPSPNSAAGLVIFVGTLR